MDRVSGIMARTVAAPCTSIRSTTSVRLASASSTCHQPAPHYGCFASPPQQCICELCSKYDQGNSLKLYVNKQDYMGVMIPGSIYIGGNIHWLLQL